MNLVGLGYDIHAFASPEAQRKLVLGGVEIAHPVGLDGHSDADVLCHAIADAVLGAIGEADIGHHFPNTDETLRGMSSLEIVRRSAQLVAQQGGRIINIVSVAALHASPGFGAYSTANNGVIAMSRTLAVELAPRGITVNCIAPGIIFTEMLAETLNVNEEQAGGAFGGSIPLGRVGSPEDTAAAAVFFASPAAEWTTGQCISVAGGP